MPAAPMPGPGRPRRIGRRRLIGAAAAVGAVAAGGLGLRWVLDEEDKRPAPLPPPPDEDRKNERRERQQRDERVDELRAQFFTGPAAELIDLATLDPDSRPDSTQLGLNAAFQHLKESDGRTVEDLIPYAMAAGVKWLRTGHRTREWDYENNRPAPVAERYVRAESEVGIRTLLQVDAADHIGEGDFIDRWLDLTRSAAEYWGEDIAAVQFDNEPHKSWGAVYGGDYRGGAWLSHYARFVQRASNELHREFPHLRLINGAHLPSVAIAQLSSARARLNAIDWHLYSFKEELPPEYTLMAKADVFPMRASRSDEVDRVAVDYRRRARRLLHDRRLQLWVTETGLPTIKPGFDPNATLAPLGDQAQAKWMARILPLLLPVTNKVFVYSLWDLDGERPATNAYYGLIRKDLEPKPAYYVLGRISALSGGRLRGDPSFQARVSDIRLGGTPRFRRVMGSKKNPVNQVVVQEEIRVVRLIGANGQPMLAIWSTHPVRPNFRPRRARIEVNTPVGPRPLLVDPLTGESRELRTDGGRAFELDIWDYPLFILADPSTADGGSSV